MDGVVIRAVTDADATALERLRQLDSRRGLDGVALVAEARGELVAAIAPASGALIADPFRRTAEIAELLRMRARQLNGGGRRPLATPRLGGRIPRLTGASR